MKIEYGHLEEFQGWRIDEWSPEVRENVAKLKSLVIQHRLKRVCEVGAGANPSFDRDFIGSQGLKYVALDQDESELEKGRCTELAVMDVCKPGSLLPGAPYDLVFSRLTAEHFRDADAAHRNIFNALRPGGFALHSFATLYSLPFLVNWLTPGNLSNLIVNLIRPRDRHLHDKFKAYYARCQGPTKKQIRFFQRIGYEVSEYQGIFGHTYYAKKLSLLHKLHRAKTNFLLKKPIPHLTSYATVILRRPV